MRFFITLIFSLLHFIAVSAIWSVGANQIYTNPSDVVALVSVGDTVEIDAGTYSGDFCIWNTDNLYIKGVGGLAHLNATGFTIPNLKAIWVINGDNCIIERIEFSNASVPDKNGAGIRMQGTNLTITHCYFHDNENGILAGDNPLSDILIEYSVFSDNGFGDGFSHNMYINRIQSFILRYSYSHNAIVGHTVKSRAANNLILFNRIMDENNGSASFLIDLPNGGKSFIIGNLIHQGEFATNGNVISYGYEGLTNLVSELYVMNNTMVNERNLCYNFLRISSTTNEVHIVNNLFVDSSCQITNYTATIDTLTNILTNNPGLVDLLNYDYSLSSSSIAIDAGSDPDSVGIYYLTPQFEYLHPANVSSRIMSGLAVDVGAYEYVFPSSENAFISLEHKQQLIKIVDVLGKETKQTTNKLLFYIYDNGRVEKRIFVN